MAMLQSCHAEEMLLDARIRTFSLPLAHWVTRRGVAWYAPYENLNRRSTSAGVLFITRHLTSRGLMNVSNPVLLQNLITSLLS